MTQERGLKKAHGPIRLGALALAIAAFGIWAPSASAALTPTLAPYPAPGVQAGSHVDFTTDLSFGGADDVKRLTFHLPPGVIGNPNVTPLCPQATFNSGTCPANTQVGTTSVSATLLGFLPNTSNGQVFNLEPSPGEPARLGVVVQTDPFGATGTIKIPVSASLRPDDGGLDATTASDIPNSVMGVPLHVTRQVLTLQGQPTGASGPFMTMPTGCPNPPDKVGVDATSYSSATPETTSTDFPVAGCDQLPFTPQLSATADVSGGSAPGTHIALETVVTQGSGQANPQQVKVTLPTAIAADQNAITRLCSASDLAAHTCPASSIIGSAFATTPLLSQPVSGPVFLTSPVGPGLLGFTALLHGQVDLTLNGYANLPNNQIASTFGPIPDVPISYFRLNFDSGPNGSLVAAQDLCTVPTQQVQADFLAHSGASLSLTPTMAVNGCPSTGGGDPHATISAKGLGKTKPTVVAHIFAGAHDLTGATLKLPGSLTAHRGHGKVRTGSHARPKAKLGKHKVRITGVAAGQRRIDVTLSKGAVTASRSLRRKLRHHAKTKLGFRLTVQQKDAAPVTLKVTVKGKR